MKVFLNTAAVILIALVLNACRSYEKSNHVIDVEVKALGEPGTTNETKQYVVNPTLQRIEKKGVRKIQLGPLVATEKLDISKAWGRAVIDGVKYKYFAGIDRKDDDGGVLIKCVLIIDGKQYSCYREFFIPVKKDDKVVTVTVPEAGCGKLPEYRHYKTYLSEKPLRKLK